ncbi:hypothetical protein MITSMUL_04067 [Mitsuokella multacida DSM 20544]|uniref:Uncharacterized protein n=1 Tax=Mitsuokella multacida DSM 20544 TaxID=500635 RepID=C9KLI3_9FIRM|nr:hypothetical protein MITSMUL_04067 [Mitsuokella multacida DSM 20544]
MAPLPFVAFMILLIGLEEKQRVLDGYQLHVEGSKRFHKGFSSPPPPRHIL